MTPRSKVLRITEDSLADDNVWGVTQWQEVQNGHARAEAELVDKMAREVALEEQATAIGKAKAKEKAASKKKLILEAPDLSKAKPTRWFWKGRIEIGVLNALVGEEKAGKSMMVARITALATKGKLPGSLKGKPSRVLIVADEDGWNDWTLRLRAAGADFDYVRHVRTEDDYGEITLGDAALTAMVEDFEPALVYFDSVLENLGRNVNENSAKDVRAALRPARIWARDLDVAVLITLHTIKAGEGTFRQQTQNSHAFLAAARNSMLVARDPCAPPDEPERRVLASHYGNHGQVPPAVTFRIEGVTLTVKGKKLPTARACDLANGGELTANGLLAAIKDKERSETKRAPSQHKQCEDLLRELVPADGKARLATPLMKKCREAGFSDSTIKNARKGAGIKAAWRKGVSPPQTEWSRARA